MATAKRHLELSSQFLEHAYAELASGDLLQASEKAWGAVTHHLNALALQRGWKVGKHRYLYENALKLIPDKAETRLQLFDSLQGLHANFYQEFLDEDAVRRGIGRAEQMIAAFDELNSGL